MFVCPQCARTFSAGGFCTEDGAGLQPISGDSLLGRQVGSYQIARLLGRGGMGEVYLGVQPSIGSRVAIKVLSADCASRPELVERFFSEARAVNVIRHESIVNVLDLAFLPDGRPYIVMEHLDGAPLSRIIAQGQALPFGGVARAMLEVLGALGAAHGAGVFHRDLKPDNIFVSPGGRAKVLDFGIAKLRPELGGQHAETRTGSLLGTPLYMSPEQARGQPVDARGDLYSVGVVLFECVTGQRPFQAASLYDLLRAQVEAPPPPPRSLRADLSPEYEAVILRALEKDAERRFQSAAEFSAALSQATGSLPTEAWAALSPPESEPSAGGVATPAAVLGGHAAATAGVSQAATRRSEGSSPEPRSRFLLLGVAVVGVLVLIALLVVGVALLSGGAVWFASRTADDGPAAGAMAPDEGSGVGLEVATDMDVGDPKRFSPSAFFTQAHSAAKRRFPDATLYSVSVLYPDAKGFVDLTRGRTQVSYIFASPAAVRDASKRRDDACFTSVTVQKGRIHVFDQATIPCDEAPVLGPPRCSLTQVMKRAGIVQARSVVLLTMMGKRMWSVSSTENSFSFADDC